MVLSCTTWVKSSRLSLRIHVRLPLAKFRTDILGANKELPLPPITNDHSGFKEAAAFWVHLFDIRDSRARSYYQGRRLTCRVLGESVMETQVHTQK